MKKEILTAREKKFIENIPCCEGSFSNTYFFRHITEFPLPGLSGAHLTEYFSRTISSDGSIVPVEELALRHSDQLSSRSESSPVSATSELLLSVIAEENYVFYFEIFFTDTDDVIFSRALTFFEGGLALSTSFRERNSISFEQHIKQIKKASSSGLLPRPVSPREYQKLARFIYFSNR